MKTFLGNCKKCGGRVCWDDDAVKCIFNSVGDCLCECPLPKDFMDWWKDTTSVVPLYDFEIWETAQKNIKNPPKSRFHHNKD